MTVVSGQRRYQTWFVYPFPKVACLCALVGYGGTVYTGHTGILMCGSAGFVLVVHGAELAITCCWRWASQLMEGVCLVGDGIVLCGVWPLPDGGSPRWSDCKGSVMWHRGFWMWCYVGIACVTVGCSRWKMSLVPCTL